MPILKVEWAAGRTEQLKKKIADELTDVMTANTGCSKEAIIVIFEDIARENLLIGKEYINLP